jgi:hypothetical protein
MRTFPLWLAPLALACAPVVEVQTDPISQAIPVTAVGLQSYVEIAIDLPPQSQGDIHVEDVSADLTVRNPSRGTNMRFSARVSLEGTATPETPYLFTELNRPAYFAQSVLVLGEKTYAAGSATPERLLGAPLIPALGSPRLWLIISNTVTSLGLGDVLPLEIRLEGIVLHAVVTKSLAGASGGLDATGL